MAKASRKLLCQGQGSFLQEPDLAWLGLVFSEIPLLNISVVTIFLHLLQKPTPVVFLISFDSLTLEQLTEDTFFKYNLVVRVREGVRAEFFFECL